MEFAGIDSKKFIRNGKNKGLSRFNRDLCNC